MKRDFSEFKKYIKNKNVGVVGMGISNIPTTLFLAELGANVTALDRRTEDKFDANLIIKFKENGIKLVLGEGYLDDLSCYEVIFKTPSIRIDNPAFIKAKENGVYITSEMKEFVKYCPAKIFGITGSDGKTTTTSIVYNILKEEGYITWVGGNIGNPLFHKIEKINKNDKVVLELSSFQLMTMDVSTDIAIITNLSPNHLDVHKNMKEYIDSKKNIFKYQDNKCLLILNRDNEITNSMVEEANGKVIQFSLNKKLTNGAYFKHDKLYIMGKEVCKFEEMKLKGMHNAANLLTAFCAVYEDASIESMRKIAISFTGVEHRCEFVRELNGVKYYNDSIASSPTRTLAGLRAFEKPVILIAGGYDKNIPFEPLAEQGYKKIKTLILIGATKEKIKAAFDKVIKEKNIEFNIVVLNTLEEAVKKAKTIAKDGDIIYLSPACASFDMFRNFEVRGFKFKELVNNLS